YGSGGRPGGPWHGSGGSGYGSGGRPGGRPGGSWHGSGGRPGGSWHGSGGRPGGPWHGPRSYPSKCHIANAAPDADATSAQVRQSMAFSRPAGHFWAGYGHGVTGVPQSASATGLAAGHDSAP